MAGRRCNKAVQHHEQLARGVEQLAVESARDLASVVQAAASIGKATLPLPDADVKYLLDETINELHRRGKIPWYGISADRHQLFVEAWAREMTRQGVRR